MRLAASPLLLLSLALTGCDASPYALFGRKDFRPGTSIAELRKNAARESRFELRCDSMWAGAQRCTLPTHAGDLRIIANDDDRILRISVTAPDSFFVWDITPTNEPIFRLHARKLRLQWDSIRASQTYSYAGGGVEYRWTSDQRWLAQMWYSPWSRYRTSDPALRAQYADSLARVPDSIAVTDVVALEKLIEEHPIVRDLMSQDGQRPAESQ